MSNQTSLTFVTGNPAKAEFISRNLGMPVAHQSVDVPEIQSLDVKEVILEKARAAYKIIGSPVLVDDAALHFTALGRLPGPLTKWFEVELSLEKMCRLLDPFDDRSASIEVAYGLFDGSQEYFFHAVASGQIADHPRGEQGFGFDPIFIHEGLEKTRGELSQEEQTRLSPRYTALQHVRTHLKA